jgi:hypothetical protein
MEMGVRGRGSTRGNRHRHGWCGVLSWLVGPTLVWLRSGRASSAMRPIAFSVTPSFHSDGIASVRHSRREIDRHGHLHILGDGKQDIESRS